MKSFQSYHQMLEEYFKEQEGSDFDLVFKDEETARSYVQKYKEAKLSSTDKIIGEKIMKLNHQTLE